MKRGSEGREKREKKRRGCGRPAIVFSLWRIVRRENAKREGEGGKKKEGVPVIFLLTMGI